MNFLCAAWVCTRCVSQRVGFGDHHTGKKKKKKGGDTFRLLLHRSASPKLAHRAPTELLYFSPPHPRARANTKRTKTTFSDLVPVSSG